MIQSSLRIFSFIIIFSIGAIGCTNASKTVKHDSKTTKTIVEPTEESVQQSGKNLYLMLRLSKNDSTNEITILTSETEIYQKPGNPLPLETEIDGTEHFTCVIKQENEEVVQKIEKKIKFTIGDSGNEAILKFILPLPEKAYSIEVNHLNEKGVWEKLYSEKL